MANLLNARILFGKSLNFHFQFIHSSISVGLVICMTVVYLFTSSKSTHVDASGKTLNTQNKYYITFLMCFSSDVTRRETTMEKINWKELNLVAMKLPDVNVNNVFIEQKYSDVHGTETFTQVGVMKIG